tara:strand:+ start:496 stop:744 length:249 start_codon:yes stop_codon:yes gene_type:complete
MKLKKLKSNVSELTFKNNYDDCEVTLLFSYETPVAGYDAKGAFKTTTKYSKTTTKHINQYFGNVKPRLVVQEYINAIRDGEA